MDIAAALDWVEENIENFGGDKNNITLVGFSAGGRDVMATLISPTFAGKYDKAISFSGGMTLADEKESQIIFAEALAPLVVEDGLKLTEEEAKNWLLTTGEDVRDYLYNLSAERLVPLMGNAMIRMAVFPHLYKDGVVIPEEGFSTQIYNDVPLMLVTGTTEFSLFSAFDPYFAADFTSGDLFKDETRLAEFSYVKTYGSELYSLSNGVESARVLGDTYKSDIYIGEIEYGNDAEVTPTVAPAFGAFHGVFEPLLQTPSNYESLIGEDFFNAGQADLSARFKAFLKAFLADGNPGKDWNAWTVNGQEILSLNGDKERAIIEMSTNPKTAEDVVSDMASDNSLPQAQKEKLNQNVLNGRWFSAVLDK